MEYPVELKVKAASLAAEARIIRKLEIRKAQIARQKDETGHGYAAASSRIDRQHIHEHRVHVVRPEARALHLARNFLAGREYDEVETVAYTEPNWKRVEEIVLKYAPAKHNELGAWLDRAEAMYTVEPRRWNKSTSTVKVEQPGFIERILTSLGL